LKDVKVDNDCTLTVSIIGDAGVIDGVWGGDGNKYCKFIANIDKNYSEGSLKI
jgi:hypothetical protein